MAESNADQDYGYSGRDVQEGNYSGAYGRGAAGETDAPSGGGGSLGAGYMGGGTGLPRPDVAGGPVDEEQTGGDADTPPGAAGGTTAGGLGSGRTGGSDVTPALGGDDVM